MVRIHPCVVLVTLATIAPTLAQEPVCSEGSPDPIVVKSWTATPAPEHGDDAVQIDYVLTNNLDVEIVDFRAGATYRREGQDLFYHSLYNDASPTFPAGGDVKGSVIAINGAPSLADPSSVTVIACTSMIVTTDRGVLEY